jgi:photosystem II stability/assembly factor-like uncharacterized protein
MNVGCRRNAAVIGSLLLLCSLGFGAWEQQTLSIPAELNGVHFPEGTQVGYAAGSGADSMGNFYGLVVKTTDGGATWQEQNTGVLLAGLNSVYFKDNDNGYAVGEAGAAIRTTDGGAIWTAMTVPSGSDMLNCVQFPENGLTGYIGVYPRTVGGKVLKTTDGGDNWTLVNVGSPLHWSRSVGMATDDIGVVVGSGGMVLMTTDGFGSTSIQGPQTTANLVAAAFSPTDPAMGYLIGSDTIRGVIRYTATGGLPLWDPVSCWSTMAFYGIDMPSSDVAYVCGTEGNILRSIYPTDFWRTTTGVTSSLYGVCFPNGVDTGYAVGGGAVILKTTDGGQPWTPGVAEGKVPATSRTGIRVVSNPSRHGIALHSAADVAVTVFDASGRILMSQAATKGLNFLPLRKAGVYIVKAGAETARIVVTD